MLIVDPATGAMYNLPDSVNVKLNSESVTLRSIDDLTAQQREKLVRLDQ
jgi:hypothetical protein|tara:strand:- start:200 stop:346 length:147 start_codon:yes stop_codon:yes gene_type:complete